MFYRTAPWGSGWQAGAEAQGGIRPMALEQSLATRLWEERYDDYLSAIARKNAYLNEFKDPEDLKQDLAINVWLKAVRAFDEEKVTYSGDVERSFNAFFQTVMGQYLASLAQHRETGKQKYLSRNVSLDQPIGKDEGEAGDRFIDMFATETVDPAKRIDLQNMLEQLPEELSGPLNHIIEHAGRGNLSEVMREVRDKWGLTQRRLYNALIEEPVFLDYITSVEV